MTRSLSRAPLSGQRVGVLGGSGRMGSAIAAEAAALGAAVTLLGRDADRLAATRAALGAGASFRTVDAADPDALETVLEALAPLDHVVVATSAGTGAGGIADTAPDAARAAFGRLWSAYAVLHLAPKCWPSPDRWCCCRARAPGRRRRGRASGRRFTARSRRWPGPRRSTSRRSG